MKIYVAASSDDRHFAHQIMSLIKVMEHEVHFWTKNRGYSDWVNFDPVRAYKENRERLIESDGLIWLLTNNKSEGAAQEAAIAFEHSIPVAIVNLGPHAHEMRVSCHIPGVVWFDDVLPAIDYLEGFGDD